MWNRKVIFLMLLIIRLLFFFPRVMWARVELLMSGWTTDQESATMVSHMLCGQEGKPLRLKQSLQWTTIHHFANSSTQRLSFLTVQFMISVISICFSIFMDTFYFSSLPYVVHVAILFMYMYKVQSGLGYGKCGSSNNRRSNV